MAACEKCWAEASLRSMYTGKSVADLYPIVLRENDGWIPDKRDDPCGGVASNPGHLVNGEWVFEDNDPECCEVHMLPWGHKREHPHDTTKGD